MKTKSEIGKDAKKNTHKKKKKGRKTTKKVTFVENQTKGNQSTNSV